MSRKTKSLWLILVLILSLAAALLITYPKVRTLFFSWISPSKQSPKGILIRNMTRQAISYEVTALDSADKSRKIHLNPGAIDEWTVRKGIRLAYSRFGNEVTEFLAPGRSYCFRYDEYGSAHLYLGSHLRKDAVDLAPYLATPIEVARKMLEIGKVQSTDILYDLGCGDGRIVNLAAKEYGSRGVGIDLDPAMIRRAEAGAKKSSVLERVEFRVEDIMKTDFSVATVIVIYLLPESNALLIPLFERQLKPGARIISHNYNIPGWEEKRVDAASMEDRAGKRHTIFLYRM